MDILRLDLLLVCVSGSCLWASYVFFRAWLEHRRFFKGLPTPPHSFWTGNIIEFLKVQSEAPKGSHPQVGMYKLREKYALGNVFYVDLWPLTESIMLICDPKLANEVLVKNDWQKHPYLSRLTGLLVEPNSITNMHGGEWKSFRHLFATTFTPMILSRRMPEIMESALVFRDKIRNLVNTNEIFPIHSTTAKFTWDVISSMVFGTSFNSQTEYHPIEHNFDRCLTAHDTAFNPFMEAKSYFKRRYYSWRADREIMHEIEQKYRRNEPLDSRMVAIDAAFADYRSCNVASKMEKDKLDSAFKTILRANIKTFLVGGSDYPATMFTCTLLMLIRHPHILARVRAEHDTVFHPDLQETERLIANEPSRLKQLPLTSACLKETMRLWPTGNAPRVAPPETSLTYEGRSYPTGNLMVWVLQYGIHRREDLWQDPTKFDPDRFIFPNHAPLDAWRPFEKGPRTCLGMELALLEVQLALVLVLREFDFELAYPADAPQDEERFGGEAYQFFQFALRPAMGLPVRAKLRRST